MKMGLAGMLLALLAMPASAEDTAKKKPAPVGFAPAALVTGKEAPVRFVLGHRVGSSQTEHNGLGYTPGGIVDVLQPRQDVVVITMSGMAAAGGLPCSPSSAGITFSLTQELDLVARDHRVQRVRLWGEGQLLGMLRFSRPGVGLAETAPAHVLLETGGQAVLDFGFSPQALSGGEKQFVNHHYGPMEVVLPLGHYTLHEEFACSASHPRNFGQRNVALSVFGPYSGQVPEWLRLLDPHGDRPARELGFQVILRVAPQLIPEPIPEAIPGPAPRKKE